MSMQGKYFCFMSFVYSLESGSYNQSCVYGHRDNPESHGDLFESMKVSAAKIKEVELESIIPIAFNCYKEEEEVKVIVPDRQGNSDIYFWCPQCGEAGLSRLSGTAERAGAFLCPNGHRYSYKDRVYVSSDAGKLREVWSVRSL